MEGRWETRRLSQEDGLNAVRRETMSDIRGIWTDVVTVFSGLLIAA